MSAVPASPTTAASISFSSMMQEPIKPNPHPYAIRTTSTGVLSRSNSSGRNLAASHHHYIPLPPSPTKREAKRHRPAKSFSSASSYPNSRHPQSLPAPPEFTSNAILPKRTRAETLPSLSPADTNSTSFFASAELPANPKLWTVSQLSFYLLGALRLPSRAPECGDPLPVAVVQDVTTILRQAQINGRHFLRLNEEDLESIGINQKWREALLDASRTLRQSAIKGKIWGPDIDSPPGSASPNLPIRPFSSALYNSSSSSVDLASDDGDEDKPRHRRRGRVRGMVETFERSGSFSSENSFSESHPEDRQSIGRWLRENTHSPAKDEVVRSPSPTHRVSMMCTDAECVLLPEEPSVEELLADDGDADRTYSWGARAWEELDIAPGVTVKRVSEHLSDAAQHPASQDQEDMRTVIVPEGSGSSGGSIRGRGSGNGRGKSERRVVTAIFTPNPSANAPSDYAQPPADIKGLGISNRERAVQTLVDTVDASRAHELALEAELTETRALVEAFRVRLESVERELAELQHLEARRKVDHVSQSFQTVDPEEPYAYAAPKQANPQDTPLPPSDKGERLADDVKSSVSQSSNAAPSVSPGPMSDDSGEAGSLPQTTRQDYGPQTRNNIDDENPASLSDLPQYVFLVGFGVCAVVLRLVVRKLAGRNSSLGWR